MADSLPAAPPRVYETVLYAHDIAAAAAWYRDVLGLAVVQGPDELAVVFRLQSGAMLLIFDPRLSSAPGRRVPSHGAEGAGHICFALDRSQLQLWRAHFNELGVEIEKDLVDEHDGARHIYVRDPAGNSVELTEDELWPWP